MNEISPNSKDTNDRNQNNKENNNNNNNNNNNSNDKNNHKILNENNNDSNKIQNPKQKKESKIFEGVIAYFNGRTEDLSAFHLNKILVLNGGNFGCVYLFFCLFVYFCVCGVPIDFFCLLNCLDSRMSVFFFWEHMSFCSHTIPKKKKPRKTEK